MNIMNIQSWIFIGRTDAEAETPVLWPPDGKNWLIGKDPEAEKDWRQEKGTTEDEMVGWHHPLDGHEFEWASGVGGGRERVRDGAKSWRRLSDSTELIIIIIATQTHISISCYLWFCQNFHSKHSLLLISYSVFK